MDKECVRIEDLISSEKESMDKHKFKFSKYLTKNNIKIFALIIVCLIVFVIFLGVDNSNKNEKKNVISKSVYTNTMEYCQELESKLEKVLSQIHGAGAISVMITLDGSPELVYAMDSDIKTSSNNNGTTSTQASTPIIVQVNGSSEPLVLTENLPKVKGVIVVSSGASDIGIKLDILNAVSTLLDISKDKISVLKGI